MSKNQEDFLKQNRRNSTNNKVSELLRNYSWENEGMKVSK